ncbi:MAG: L,D-transpeptidase [Gammaproteobacteria bacterium]|nr:L,D-transpeptidase [Gammaproteobacteria bacterium]
MPDSKTAEKLLPILQQACEKYPQHADFPAAIVSVSEQALYLFIKGAFVCSYPVSTSRNGIGQEEGSNQTPIGIHYVKEKIGADAEFAEIFLYREQTNSFASIEHEAICTEVECITSRILWLAGLEEGVNKAKSSEGHNVDSYQRYIYIHGTHEEGLIGQAASIGCVRMKNADVIDLFEKLFISSLVIIKE